MTTTTVPRTIRAVTTASVALVALVAGVVSYMHMHEVAARVGEGPRAWLVPLAVDGLMVAASMTMLVRRRAGQPVGLLVWTSLLMGAGASLGANIVAAEASLLARTVAAWPAVALLLAYEMLMSQVTSARHTAPVTVSGSVPEPAAAPEIVPAPAEPATAPAQQRTTRATMADQRDAARQTYRDSVATGTPLTDDELAALFGRTDRWARARIAEARQTRVTPVAATVTAVA